MLRYFISYVVSPGKEASAFTVMSGEMVKQVPISSKEEFHELVVQHFESQGMKKVEGMEITPLAFSLFFDI